MSRQGAFDPWIVLLLLMTVAPVLGGLAFMMLYGSGMMGLLAGGFTLRYWMQVLTDAQTWQALLYSVYLGGASLAASLSLALALQAALGPRLRTGALRGLLYLPMAVPPLVAALLSIELFGNAGLLSRVAHAIGFIEWPADFPALLYSASGLGVIVTHMTLVTPFLLLLFDRIERHEQVGELEQVACTLGASRWQSWRRVRLPVFLRAGGPVLSVYLVVLIGAYEVPLLVGAQHPSMISVLIQRRFAEFDLGTRPKAYALASIYALLATGLLLILFGARARRLAREQGA